MTLSRPTRDNDIHRTERNMERMVVLVFPLLVVSCLVFSVSRGHTSKWVSQPPSVPNVVAFWIFSESAGKDRVDVSPNHYHLREDGGPIELVKDGMFTAYSAYLTPGKRFVLPRREATFLNFRGKSDNKFTIVSWIKRMPYCGTPNYTSPYPCCEFIAGIFNESSNHRQYGLFLNLHSFNSSDQVCGLVSDNGGDTPGHKGCVSGSFGQTKVPYNKWQCVAISYDNKYVKSYLNGRLDRRGTLNPNYYPNGIFDPSSGGADFTVGGNDAFGEKHNYFHGLMGGLQIFNTTFTEEEMSYVCGKLPN